MSGKAPPPPETVISGLTRRQLVGEDQIAKSRSAPALPDVRPAPKAGCFVSGPRLSYATADSGQVTLRAIEHDGCFGPFCQ